MDAKKMSISALSTIRLSVLFALGLRASITVCRKEHVKKAGKSLMKVLKGLRIKRNYFSFTVLITVKQEKELLPVRLAERHAKSLTNYTNSAVIYWLLHWQ
jgi:hypothetical protein